MPARRVLPKALRVAVIALGVPLLVSWAVREQAFDWRHGFGWHLLAGIALSQLAFALYAQRFRAMLAITGIALARIDALRIALLSLFYHFFVPLSVGGDIAKFVTLKARAHGSAAVAAAIVSDHFVGLTTLIAVSAGLYAWRRPLPIDPGLGAIAAVVVLGAVTAGVLAVALQRRRGIDALAIARRLVAARGLLARAFLLSLAMHLVFAGAVWVAAHPWGLDLDFPDLLFALATALVFQAIPVNVGGVGVAELAGTGLYLALGVPLSGAVLLVSLPYLFRLVGAIAGGLWDLLPPQREA